MRGSVVAVPDGIMRGDMDHSQLLQSAHAHGSAGVLQKGISFWAEPRRQSCTAELTV